MQQMKLKIAFVTALATVTAGAMLISATAVNAMPGGVPMSQAVCGTVGQVGGSTQGGCQDFVQMEGSVFHAGDRDVKAYNSQGDREAGQRLTRDHANYSTMSLEEFQKARLHPDYDFKITRSRNINGQICEHATLVEKIGGRKFEMGEFGGCKAKDPNDCPCYQGLHEESIAGVKGIADNRGNVVGGDELVQMVRDGRAQSMTTSTKRRNR